MIHVNGQPWPFFQVQPRKYRFRFLNAGISRSFILYFEKATGARANFQVIASDAGLLSGPVTVSSMALSVAERYEVVFDFAPFAGQNVTLRNEKECRRRRRLHQHGQGDALRRLFPVGGRYICRAQRPEERAVPGAERPVSTITFRFERNGGLWAINGVGWHDVSQRVLANVPRGTVEVWELENGSGGGWTHPIHVHLVDFKVVSRTGGRNAVQPYEAVGLKDVVWLDTGETVRVEAHYAPWDGVCEFSPLVGHSGRRYTNAIDVDMFHCHNLIHEDHEMLAAFNVTALPDLGYNETHFIDPMEPRWRAEAATPEKFTPQAIEAKIQFLESLQPYSKADEVFSVLDNYWATKTAAPPRALLRRPR